VAEVLSLLADAAAAFEAEYRFAVASLRRSGLPLVLCTIYNGNFPDPAFQRIASTALCVFNDVIVRAALEQRLRLIDLRLVCSDPADYANAIEPSSRGGLKIAQAIVDSLK
jgi:hypothetical protein